MSTLSLNTDWHLPLVQKIVDHCRHTVTDWCAEVDRLGLSPSVRESWADRYCTHVFDLLSDMHSEVELYRDEIITDIEALLQRIGKLCKQLNVPMPLFGANGLSLSEERDQLKHSIEDYEREAKKKTQEIEKMRKRYQTVCKQLELSPDGNDLGDCINGVFPTEAKLLEWQSQIEDLETTLYTRTEHFLKRKADIVELVEKYCITPDLNFEKDVVHGNVNKFVMSQANMEQLDAYWQRVQDTAAGIEQTVEELRVRVRSLWDILAEDVRVCQDFLQRWPGSTQASVNALREEIERCEAIKKANIEIFIGKLRAEITSYWDKCHFTNAERSEFTFFHQDHFTEDLLTLHDLERERLKLYYEKNTALFELLSERAELWEKKLLLEEKQVAPNRYENRGGQLLREERERNAVAKKIPRIEQQLRNLADKFEAEYGRPFRSWGTSICELIDEQYVVHEEEKKSKLSARKVNREMQKITPGKSCTTINLEQLVPSAQRTATAKRRLLTPSVSTSKRIRTAMSIRTPCAGSVPKLQLNGRSVSKDEPTSGSPKHVQTKARQQKCRRVSDVLNDENCNPSNLHNSYSDFSSDVNNGAAVRSTIFNSLEGADMIPSTSSAKPTTVNARTLRAVRTPRGTPASARRLPIGTPRRTPAVLGVAGSSARKLTPSASVASLRSATKLRAAPSMKLLF